MTVDADLSRVWHGQFLDADVASFLTRWPQRPQIQATLDGVYQNCAVLSTFIIFLR